MPPAPSATSEEESDSGLLGNAGGVRRTLRQAGVTLSCDYAVEALGNVAGGMEQGAVVDGLLWFEVDFDFAQAGLWEGATAHTSVLLPHGDSLSQKYVGDLFTLSNLDARDALVLFELWFEQTFEDPGLSLRLGQLSADQEFAICDYGTLFINSTCGWPGLIAVDGPAPAYPYGALGARFAWSPAPRFTLRGALYDGDPNSFDAEGKPDNEHGIKYRLGDGALAPIEAELSWNRNGSATGQPGVLRVGGWFHTGEFESMREDGDGRSLADPASSGIPRVLTGNGGAYGVLEQRLFSEEPRPEPGYPADPEPDPSQGLGCFVRIAVAPQDRNPASLYFEGGLVWRGLIPGRDQDQAGLACACGRMSDGVRGLAEDALSLGTSTDPVPDHELILEAEYQLRLCRDWTLQPGIHFIQHPGGSSAIDDALVLSLRSTLAF